MPLPRVPASPERAPATAGPRAHGVWAMDTVDVSLVIPTRNERENITPLLSEIRAAMAGSSWEALFADDSTDGTDAVIARLAADDSRIRLLHRPVNRGGLAGAVAAALPDVRGAYVCVLDADLQHPPDKVPDMVREAERTGADIVIASRYITGGGDGGLDGRWRQFYSRGLKALSKLAFPRRLAGISDPLGGFFLVRRSALGDVQLRPVGYKILLEILIRCPWQRVCEAPYRFRPRRHGDSNAGLREGMHFLRHLAVLVFDCSPLFSRWKRNQLPARDR